MTLKTIAAFDRIGEENAFAVLARANALSAQGRDIINLGIGQPDFRTPEHIVEAAVKALRDGHHGYTPATGIPALREAVAQRALKTTGVEVSPDQVLIVPGGKVTMFAAILMFGEPGADILYPDPGFPIYRSMIEFTGARPVPVPIREENGFAFSAEETLGLINDKTRLIIINSPANPTGGVLDRAQLQRIADIAKARRIPVLSDEIYRQFLYEGEFASIMSLPGMHGQTILLDGFSKSYAMTGWRLGYGVMPTDLAEHITRLMVNSASCTASFVQLAGVAALHGDQTPVTRMVAEFKRRRDLIVDGLNALPGVKCARPRGAFYVFPNVTGTGRSSTEVAERMLTEAGVAALSGGAFGVHGEGYLRLSYANSEANLRLALDRMRPLFESFKR
jgi:aspartate aminotransferase